MQKLGKILEEIDEMIERYKENPRLEVVDICCGLNQAKRIILKHMSGKDKDVHANSCLVNGENMMNSEEKIRYIADYYGYEPQSRQLIEEMAELTVAINKLWRRHEYGATSKEIAKAHMDVLEEIADVTVMLCQIQYLLGISSPELDYATERKLNRQIERIHKITREE